MYFDRLDIITAWYLWLDHNHGGQWSDEYVRLCKICTYFNPSPLLRYETLSDNAKVIYDNLCLKHNTK
jgi:hypothetical protein